MPKSLDRRSFLKGLAVIPGMAVLVPVAKQQPTPELKINNNVPYVDMVIDGVPLKRGTGLLLINQTQPQINGIYEIETMKLKRV